MNGYRQIRPSGPCPGSGISAIAVVLLTVAARRLAVVLTAAGLLATIAGLIITIQTGLFGLRENWGAATSADRCTQRSPEPSPIAACPLAWAEPGVDASVSRHAGHR